MTILEPNKAKRTKKINVMLFGTVSALFGLALLSLVVYNNTVNLSRGIKTAEREYKAELNANAELKNELFKSTDMKMLRTAAGHEGLVVVTNPEYIEVSGAVPLAAAER